MSESRAEAIARIHDSPWCGVCQNEGRDTPAEAIGLDGNGQAHFVCADCTPVLFHVIKLEVEAMEHE